MPPAANGLTAILPALAPMFDIGAFRAVRALRLMALAETVGIDPQSRLIEILGNVPSANAFRLLLTTMSAAWPDPLAVFRPCARHLTHDERALLTMLHHARAQDRPAFDRHLINMIAPDARNLLYGACLRFYSAQTAI